MGRLSSDSELVVARKSGHLIHLDEPELVVDAVRRVHWAICDRVRLTPADTPLSGSGTLSSTRAFS